jgi:hypothetical protein
MRAHKEPALQLVKRSNKITAFNGKFPTFPTPISLTRKLGNSKG